MTSVATRQHSPTLVAHADEGAESWNLAGQRSDAILLTIRG
jgi:hypothetical protein